VAEIVTAGVEEVPAGMTPDRATEVPITGGAVTGVHGTVVDMVAPVMAPIMVAHVMVEDMADPAMVPIMGAHVMAEDMAEVDMVRITIEPLFILNPAHGRIR